MAQDNAAKALYVGNLHPYVNEAVLQDIFSTLGTVTEVRIVKDKATGGSAGSAFVHFADHNAAEAALNAINGRALYNQELRIQWAFQKEKTEDTSNHFHIFVGNLSAEVTDPYLKQAFEPVGDCSDARVMWDHSTGRSKGFGFVSFRTKEAAEKALKEMDGAAVGQWRLRVGWAHHKQDSEKQLNADAISKADPANNNVYVGNLAPEVTEADLRQEFGNYGGISSVKLVASGSYGFVTFEDHDAAVQAIVGMSGKDIRGKAIKCSWGRHQAKTGTAGVAAQMGMQSAVPGMQYVSGGPMGMQPLPGFGPSVVPHQQAFQGHMLQPAFAPGQLSYQGSMDYMGASTQLPGQTGQYGSQYGLPQQYQQQQHYGAAVQQAASQQMPHAGLSSQDSSYQSLYSGQISGLGYGGQYAAGGQQQMLSQNGSNAYYGQH